MRKERRGLSFRVSLGFLNLMFKALKKRAYKLTPKDAEIHSISPRDMCWDGYTLIVTSKEFPIVEEGKTCLAGIIWINKDKKIIELKKEE